MPRVNMTQPSTSRATREQNRNNLSASQPVRNTEAPSDGELDQHIVNTVKAILNLSVNKQPIKKTDIVRIGLAGNGRIFAKVIGPATDELSDVYGYKLVETERNKIYFLVSKIPCGSMLELSEEYQKRYTLLYLVLGYIFMKNGTVPEQGLWDFLAKLGIHDQEEHQYFGIVHKWINDSFIKQGYLVRAKQIVEGMNDDRFLYSWGVRANLELSKKDILESICKVLQKPSICYITQHTAAYGAGADDDEAMDQSQD